MDELSRTEKWLEKAFKLAYFIHGDREIAKQIAFNSMNKLEVASNAQYKRFYYTPDARNARSKVSMNDLQLLQRLVYVESEAFEKEKEFTETASEKDLLIYFIKHLIRITLKRNSFYVTLGLSRILHNYGTNEAMEIYNVVVQDPEKVHDDYYYRSRKGVLMKELKNRFGEKLEIASVNRGEQRFETTGSSPLEAEVVKNCLRSFTPWNTACSLPEKFNPFAEVIESLCFSGKNADDEHRIELNRMHVLLNPETFQKVVNSLSFPLPEEKLEIPKFNMKRKNENSNDRDKNNPPSLEFDELKQMAAMLQQEATRRKLATCGNLRVLVDGEEVGFYNSAENKSNKFNFDREFAEMIEVYAVENGRDTLLATYLLGGGDDFENTAMRLENGQKISFNFAEEDFEITFSETNLRRKIKCWWRRTVFALSNPTKILRPIMATCGLLLAFLIATLVYFNLTAPNSKLIVKITNENIENKPLIVETDNFIQSQKVEVAPTQTVIKPEIVKNPLKKVEPKITSKNVISKAEKIQNKTSETKIIEPKVNKEKEFDAVETTEIAEVKKFPVIEKREDSFEVENTTRSVNESGKSIKNTKYIYVEVSGDDKFGRQIGEQMMDKLNANKRFLAVNNKDKADGLLKISVRREHDHAKDENTIVSATVRLVNADGFVVFPSKKRVSAWRYVGNATKIPTQIVKDLTR